MNVDKREAQFQHARGRAWQRFGCDLSERDVAQLVRSIQKRHARFIANQAREKSVWAVTLPNGKLAHVIFNSDTRMIATVFPPAWGAGTTEGKSIPFQAA